jgi:predicted transposase YdaD
MPFITSAERVGREEGLAEGLEKGRQEAREDLLAGIEAVLDVKFAEPGLALMPEIRNIQDLAVLRKILRAAKQADGPEAVRRVWTPA